MHHIQVLVLTPLWYIVAMGDVGLRHLDVMDHLLAPTNSTPNRFELPSKVILMRLLFNHVYLFGSLFTLRNPDTADVNTL